ncbi:hypothetical protein DL771_009291 [Monosporascus sp. 5C6A]|nr:hypothetical protein DL771_009291 [Monosporascus sp. 5C6A]
MNPFNNTASYAGARALFCNLQNTGPNIAQSSMVGKFEEAWGHLKIQINSFNPIVSIHTSWYRNWDSGMKQSITHAMVYYDDYTGFNLQAIRHSIDKINVRFTQIPNLPDRVFLGAVEDLHKAGIALDSDPFHELSLVLPKTAPANSALLPTLTASEIGTSLSGKTVENIHPVDTVSTG